MKFKDFLLNNFSKNSLEQKTPFLTTLNRASRRLEMFFRRCQNEQSIILMDHGISPIVCRMVKAQTIEDCFNRITCYDPEIRSNADLRADVLLIFTTGSNKRLKEYIECLNNTTALPKKIVLVFAHRCTFTARKFLEAHGYLHIVKIEELRLPAWITDADFAISPFENSFSNVILNGGRESVEQLAQTLMQFPSGEYFSNMYLIGDTAIQVGTLLPQDFRSAWTDIVIFDRQIDKITPFLTPFSYEAFIAESIGIEYGVTTFNDQGTHIELLFGDQDNTSTQVRNLPVSEAGPYLSALFEAAEQERKSLSGAKEVSVDQFRKFSEKTIMNASLYDHVRVWASIRQSVLDLPAFHQRIQLELDLLLQQVDDVSKFLDSQLVLENDWRPSIRMLAIYCQTAKSINQKTFELMRQNIIDRFGLNAIGALWSLDEAKIITDNPKKINWANIRQSFRLFSDSPQGIELPYQGYVPLIARIVEMIVKKKWIEASALLEKEKIPLQVKANRNTERKRTLVVFVGGAMYGEIACLRHLTKQVLMPFDILTTECLTTNDILKQMIEV